MKPAALACLIALAPLPAAAHPHIYIDAGLTFMIDTQGNLAAIKVSWSYDEFYSLLQLEEMGLDQDGDGIITVAEQEKLKGFDTQWVAGYEGDLYVSQNGTPVALGGPVDAGASLEDGRLLTWHTRPILTPLDPTADEIQTKAYDPTFYTAYTLDLGAEVTGSDACTLTQIAADLPKAYDKLESLLYGADSAQFDEDGNFPQVGAMFADTVTLTCGP